MQGNTRNRSAASQVVRLGQAVKPAMEKLLNLASLAPTAVIKPDGLVMVLLAAGKGTRFGQEPKCAQLVNGLPLARHSIAAFKSFSDSPVVCIVGYRAEEVAAALGDGNFYVRSDNPAGGTAFAAYEAFSVPDLELKNPVLIVSMGDRIVPSSVFKKLLETHHGGAREADLTFLTAIYEPPRNRGKGRIIRDADRRVLGIVEQRDIDAIADGKLRQPLDDLTEGNCPLYAIRARTFRQHLEGLSNDNIQGQYYLTDIIESIRNGGGEIRTITTTVADAEYDLLCSDVTRPMDLALLEGLLRSSRTLAEPVASCVMQAAQEIRAERPSGQIASITLQLSELVEAASKLAFKPDQPVAIGIAGGRLRVAFMHPDMGRFFGPAWQMPIGAGDASGREQIVVLIQGADDGRVHLLPTHPDFQEKINSIEANADGMYPGEEVNDWYSYESFGTRMTESVLLALGYFSDAELKSRRKRGQPIPPPSLWLSTSMRRPFSLVMNALSSLRTVRAGRLGLNVQTALGKERFRGLRIVVTGNIPRGGFSSSSAVTVATKNAINALFDLGLSPDLLVHLSCQAEYGTGVRAGSLDQATEQKGRPNEGTLLSSNPRDNYRILGAYPVPAERFPMLFPYSVDRDREAWQWSAGTYASAPGPGGQTTGEMRKLTGKAAEMAALLLRLPLEQDFFKRLEEPFLRQGKLGSEAHRWVCDVLRELPLLMSREELRQRVQSSADWYIDQLIEVEKLDRTAAAKKAAATFDSLFSGWRDPCLRRAPRGEKIIRETGVPLRAMVAYLFTETAKNFYLIHHPDEWIRWISRSQWGDRCFEIDPGALPDTQAMMTRMEWEKGLAGPSLMVRWLERFGARPFDYNRGLSDEALSRDPLPELQLFEGSNFFRGLALIDLAEAMLQRAFGEEAVAVRINAAGQGDFFQVHVDAMKADVNSVKHFIKKAFYERFDLSPDPEFVEVHPGGGAVGVRLDRFDQLPVLVQALQGI
jgi:molybdopterin-guanine dinucleotide biosynthesis protein A